MKECQEYQEYNADKDCSLCTLYFIHVLIIIILLILSYNYMFRFLSLATVILLLDQGVKQLILKGEFLPYWLIKDQIGLVLEYNSGIAFSIPVSGTISLILSALIIISLVYYKYFYVEKSVLAGLVFAMIVGGALGNLIDRIRLDKVVDYIKILSWPTFNLADIFITLGFLFLIISFKKIRV